MSHCYQRAPLASLLAAGVLLGGCFSSEQGEAIKRDVEQLKKEISSRTGKADQERKQLQKVMEQATALLTRNSADVGAQVERLQTQNSKLFGQIEESNKAINDLNTKLAQIQAKVEVNAEKSEANTSTPPPQTLNKDDLYGQAKRKMAAGDHVVARKLLRQFIGRFPGDSRAPVAQRMVGDSYYLQQKFAAAVIEYRKILQKYKSSSAVGDALYKIGMSFYQLKYCSDARSFLTQFTRRFRRHRQASNAKKLIKLIYRYRRNRQFCRS